MEEHKHQVEMGLTVIDKITGFKGVVTSYCHNITGCDQVVVQPKVDKDGKVPENRWLDVNRCVVKNTKKIILDTEVEKGAIELPAHS